MTSDRIARDYLRRAKGRRAALQTLVASELYADVVRESQEVVELILKGTLRFIGVDPPKRHDVHAALERFLDRLPSEWRDTLPELDEILVRLTQDRSRAFYGDEDEGVPASDLFDDTDASDAVGVVDRLLGLYEGLLEPPGQG